MLKLYLHRATAKKFYPQAYRRIPSPSPKLHLLIYVFRILVIFILFSGKIVYTYSTIDHFNIEVITVMIKK